MKEVTHGAPLLPTLAAITRIAQSLYGPGKARKQITDENGVTQFTSDAFAIVQSLQSEHAALAILRATLRDHKQLFGTRCTTLLNLTSVLSTAAIELERQRVPVDVIRNAFAHAERSCLQTLAHMRLSLADAISNYEHADVATQRRLLGEHLQTHTLDHSSNDNSSSLTLAMQLALDVLTNVDTSCVFDADRFPIDAVLASTVALGGAADLVASSRGSQVFPGVLVPIASSHSARLCRWFTSLTSDSNKRILTANRTVVIDSDCLRLLDDSIDDRVNVVFVSGDVDAQTLDQSWRVDPATSHQRSLLIIPIADASDLQRLATLSGATIVDAWSDVVPFTIGRTPLALRLVELTATRIGSDDEDDKDESEGEESDGEDDRIGTRRCTQRFVHVACAAAAGTHQRQLLLQTLLVRGATRADATALEQCVRTSLHRVVRALRSGYVLPTSGAYLCACAAETQLRGRRVDDATPTWTQAIEHVAAALRELAALLLHNTGGATRTLYAVDSADCFANAAAVQRVQRNYSDGIDGDSDDNKNRRTQFYARCYFHGADFNVLASLCRQTKATMRLDDYDSVCSAFERSFQLVDRMLSIATYRINTRPGATEA